MGEEIYVPTDRRPLASREKAIWRKAANSLAAAGVSPNAISIVGMICGLLAGACLFATDHFAGWSVRILFLAAAGLTQLRLLANLLDGMVAVAAGKASRLGELYNEIPDRISDAAILIGAGYALGGNPAAGFLATCLAILTAYIRAVGKSAGASQLFLGPMAKPHRMFVITVASIYPAVSPNSWQPIYESQGVMAGVLWLICLGAIVTCIRRLARIVEHLKSQNP